MFGSCRTAKLSCKCTLREHCGAPRGCLGSPSYGWWQSHGMKQGDVGPTYSRGWASLVGPSNLCLRPHGDCKVVRGGRTPILGGPKEGCERGEPREP